VSSVSLWLIAHTIVNHRDTEDTEVAQRNQIKTVPVDFPYSHKPQLCGIDEQPP
jgi:hypothetical protein